MSRSISPPPTKRTPLVDLSEKRWGSEQRITIYSWNVNGIQPFIQRPITSFFGPKRTDLEPGQSELHSVSLRAFLRRHGWPTVVFLQEVKINPDDKATISAVEKAVKRRDDEDGDSFNYHAHFCLPSDKHNARGFGRKVYGVCSIIREDFYLQCVETVRPVSWDKEGRFLIAETKASDASPKLALINVYAVNGTDNPYKDRNTGELKGTRHGRKLEVHALLQAEIARLEAGGFQCVIAGDINIARSALDGFPNLRTFPKQHCINRADFEARFLVPNDGKDGEDAAAPCLGMVDTFRQLHPDTRGYTYYPRTKSFGGSCDRVDMILVSKGLKESLIEAGIHETPADRGPSDHVPLYTTLNLRKSLENVSRDHGTPD